MGINLQNEYKNLNEFMKLIGGVKVEDIFDKKIKIKAYEDNDGYLMVYNFQQAKELAIQNGLHIGSLSVHDKGLSREGDSNSKSASLYCYQTSEYGINVKKYFFFSKKIEAFYEELY